MMQVDPHFSPRHIQAPPLSSSASPSSSSRNPLPHEKKRHFEASLQPLLQPTALSSRLSVLTLVDLITNYGIKDVDVTTRLGILTEIRDRAGVKYLQSWAEYTPAMKLVREWLGNAVNPRQLHFVETVVPLLQILDRLQMTADHLKVFEFHELVEQIAVSNASSTSKLVAVTLLQKWLPLVENVGSSNGTWVISLNGKRKADERMVLDPPQQSKKRTTPRPPNSTNLKDTKTLSLDAECAQCGDAGLRCGLDPNLDSEACRSCLVDGLECSLSWRGVARRRWRQWAIVLVSNIASRQDSEDEGDDDDDDYTMSDELPSTPDDSSMASSDNAGWSLTTENILEYVEAAMRVIRADQDRWMNDNSGTSILFAIFKEIISVKSLYQQVLSFRGHEAQLILNSLQLLLDHPRPMEGSDKHNFLKALLRLSSRSGLYPKCLALKQVERSEQPITAGHFAEVYRGRFRGQNVGLKVVKLYERSQVSKILKVVSREAILWSHLSHCNLLPFYGIYHLDDGNSRVCMVSPWMENGNVTEHLFQNPDVNRLLLVSDIAMGVAYLHENNVTHGDLKGVNILVGPSGRACLADFGLSNLVDSEVLSWTSLNSTSLQGGTTRWQAPELFDPDDDHPMATKKTDIYSFSCICYEILTDNLPFYEYPRDATVMMKVMAGQRPSKPNPDGLAYRKLGLTDALWSLMEECWQRNPEKRPTAADILRRPSVRDLMDTRPKGDWDGFSSSQFRIAMNMLSDI